MTLPLLGCVVAMVIVTVASRGVRPMLWAVGVGVWTACAIAYLLVG